MTTQKDNPMLEGIFCYWRYGLAHAGYFTLLFAMIMILHFNLRNVFIMSLLCFSGTFCVVHGLIFFVSDANPLAHYAEVFSSEKPIKFFPYITMLYLGIASIFYAAIPFLARKAAPGQNAGTKATQNRD